MRVNKNETAKYRVIARVMCGVKVAGYIVEDTTGRKIKVRKRQFDELALKNEIYNCSANIYNGNVNLRGIGMTLKELPTITLKKGL